jgi:hypothetical protein
VVRLARENSGWGYDRIVGALANLGYPVSDQTVGNILRRHGIAPVPERSKVKCLRLPPRSPNLNAFAKRWVRSVKEECLSHLILFGDVLLFPAPAPLAPGERRGIRCRERLGGLLRYYSRAA